MSATAGLWLVIVALGAYHGLNPAMGWPLAVANGLARRRPAAVFGTVLPLGAGHFAAMAIVLVPLAALNWYVAWSRPLRLAAGAAVLLFGVFRLVERRHPRLLARIPPTRLAWWSFLMATAHGAGLMLVPFTLGLCEASPAAGTISNAHASLADALARSGPGTALAVATVHTAAMMLTGVTMAWLVYRYLGLQFLRRSWLNLDRFWAASLVLAGSAGLATAL